MYLAGLLSILLLIVIEVTQAETFHDFSKISDAVEEVKRTQAIVIDVRGSTRKGSISIENAFWVQLPLVTQDLPLVYDRLASCIPEGKKVFVVCYVGSFAEFFAHGLRQRGVDAKAAGGFHDWVEAGVGYDRLRTPALNVECPF